MSVDLAKHAEHGYLNDLQRKDLTTVSYCISADMNVIWIRCSACRFSVAILVSG